MSDTKETTYESAAAAAQQTAEEHRLANLKGEFAHCCPKWDGLAIDESMPEFDVCICSFNGVTAAQIRDAATQIRGAAVTISRAAEWKKRK